MSGSHSECVEAGEHVCAVPSGRTCVERGCNEPAGTRWGPYWCPEHDQIRLNRVSDQMHGIMGALTPDVEEKN